MNAWKTMLVYTLLAMVAAPMFAPATNKAPLNGIPFCGGNNMFKVKTAEKRKTGRTDPNWPSKAVRNSSRVPRKDIQANTQPPGGETDDHRTCIYP